MSDIAPPFSDKWEAANDALRDARTTAREITIAEIRRFLPAGGEIVCMWWSDSIENPTLHLHEIRDTAGVVVSGEEELDEFFESDEWNAIDTLCSYLADDYYDADNWFLRDPEREGGEYFILDYTTPEGGTDGQDAG